MAAGPAVNEPECTKIPFICGGPLQIPIGLATSASSPGHARNQKCSTKRHNITITFLRANDENKLCLDTAQRNKFKCPNSYRGTSNWENRLLWKNGTFGDKGL
jgi:hypothetical protein